jgi:plastocyanin
MKRRAWLKIASAAAVVAVAVGFQGAGFPVVHAAGATHTVSIEGMAFVPATLTVRKGDTIVWANRDLVPHTATAQDKSFDSREIPAGKSWKLVAKTGGKMAYVCTFHPTMKGLLQVD